MNKILMIALVVMLGFTTVALLATKENASSLPPDSSSGKASIGGVFNLTSHEGKAVNDVDFHGKYSLVFFGFTHCPDICPVAMATITAAMNTLGDKAEHITPVFITVDPARDTPEVMKKYLANFDQRIVGLTGSEEQVKQAAAAYKAYYAAQELPAHKEHAAHEGHGDGHAHQSNYMVDHSGLMYLMNEKGEYVTHFAHDVAADVLAQKIGEQVK